MAEEGLVRRHKRKSKWEPTLWSLPGYKQPISSAFRQHYIDTTNIAAAYWPLQHWDEKWLEEDYANYDINNKVPMYDARMKKWDAIMYWEVDRGTEEMEDLFEKVDKYIDFSDRYYEDRFHVIFTLQYFRFGEDQDPAQRLKKLRERSDELLDYLIDKKRGNQFLIAWHDHILADPYGSVYVSPLDPSTPQPLQVLLNAAS